MSAPNGHSHDAFDEDDEEYSLQEELDAGFAEIEERYAVNPQKGVENVIVVDNIPIVDESRKDRLIERLRQVFERSGAGIEEDRIEMPWDEAAGKNKGFIFLTYPDAQQAENALRALDNLAFGRSNTLYVNRFGDIEQYAKSAEGEGKLPSGWADKAFVEREYTHSWLGDAQGRDQFLTFRDMDVNLHWAGRNGTSEPVKTQEGKVVKNSKWGELYLQWSPLGTYLASLHRVGVALWSGPRLDGPVGVNVLRFTHPGVRLIQFSPCEKYLITWSDEPLPHPSTFANPSWRADDEGSQIIVWDLRTVRLLQTFPSDPNTNEDGSPRPVQWPVFKWSPDDAYVAKCNVGKSIAVFETPAMTLLEKKSVKIEGVQDFEWAPMSDEDWEARKAGKGKENVIVYWVPEAQNQPARVVLMSLPSKNVLASKNLFNVSECKFYWQSQGDYLCVKVDRHARKARNKKATFCNLEIFRIRDKSLPVEVIELKVPQFAWEPQGKRFAIVSTNDPNHGQGIPGVIVKYSIVFYAIDPKKSDFVPVRTLENKIANHLAWGPKGRFIALATLGSASKFDIEFWDLDFTTDDNPRKEGVEPGQYTVLLGTGDHYGVTEMMWDPSGRYLATVASAWRQSPETGYDIWDFKGQQLVHSPLDRFKQFLWRPRPPSLLKKSAQRNIRKSLKEHHRVFDDEDAAEENRGSAEKLAQRQRDIAEWNAWRARNVARLAEERRARGKEVAAKVQVEDDAEEKVEEWVEELIDETEEVEVGSGKKA